MLVVITSYGLTWVLLDQYGQYKAIDLPQPTTIVLSDSFKYVTGYGSTLVLLVLGFCLFRQPQWTFIAVFVSLLLVILILGLALVGISLPLMHVV